MSKPFSKLIERMSPEAQAELDRRVTELKDVIECWWCHAKGWRYEIHQDGWQLAANKPFAYVCTHCKDKP